MLFRSIGVFYGRDDELYCGGYGIWDDDDLIVICYGDDENTTIKDGFSENEIYTIKLWDAQVGKVRDAVYEFRDGDPTTFQVNDTSYITSLNSIDDIQNIRLGIGWNMISSYVEPDIENISDLMLYIENNLVVVKNNRGDIFYPSFNINTIGNWEYSNGYQIYMEKSDTLKIRGTKLVPENTGVNLQSGWNMVTYLRDNELDAVEALNSVVTNLVIVKNSAGNIYFPLFNINTIGNMIPGQGYQIYLNAEDSLVYPPND